MNQHERAYVRALMRKRDEYLRARDEEFIVPERPPSLGGYFQVYEVQIFLENLNREWRKPQ